MEAHDPNTPESDDNNELGAKDNHDCVPIANVSRIMKRMVPDNVKIAKESKELVQQCVSEFICFITGEASEHCKREKRKTINGEDILWSMGTLGFQDYMGPLKKYLDKYREAEGDKRSRNHSQSRR